MRSSDSDGPSIVRVRDSSKSRSIGPSTLVSEVDPAFTNWIVGIAQRGN